VMLGDGILMADIQRAIERLKLKDRIHLPGWVSEEDVLAWLVKSDILFMPSLAEGLPITGLQGLAMGLAMVLSRVGGCVNLVKPGQNGFLVDPGDLKGYADALRQILTQPDLLKKFRQASLVHSRQFQMKAVVDSYDKMYKSIFQQK
jgi:glycosyltransferase involved in cell wall biosynthesis